MQKKLIIALLAMLASAAYANNDWLETLPQKNVLSAGE
jgi:uncharacterized GH25 family protein